MGEVFGWIMNSPFCPEEHARHIKSFLNIFNNSNRLVQLVNVSSIALN